MLKSISITSAWVFDQAEALDFYVNKLGLVVQSDADLGFMRWLTVCVPGEESREILLQVPAPPIVDEETAGEIRTMVRKGATGMVATFTTDDCRATHADLVAKGVEITQEPTDHFYGTDIGLRDPFGNHLRIVQLAEVMGEYQPGEFEAPTSR